MIRRSISLGVVLATSIGAASCDSTVWLDDTLPSLTAVFASGACQTSPNQIDVSVVLVNQTDSASSNILPTTRVAKEGATPVSELISSQSFKFNPPPIMEAKVQQGLIESGDAYGELEDGIMTGDPLTVDLSPQNVSFEWSSPDPEAERIPLLILLMDQSHSVLGLSRSEQRWGSDIGHQRITFFSTLIKSLDERFEVAMLTFAGFTSDYNSDGSVVNRPIRNKDIATAALEDLKFSAKYEARTPLNQALSDTKAMIEGLAADTYDPVVVVFTDGLESGDNSMGAPTVEELAPFFVQRHIPVHTVQLRAQQDPNPSSGDLEAEEERPKPLENMSLLACQTGGDFYFIRNPEDFTNNNALGTMLRNRLSGRWSLKVQTTMFNSFMNVDAPGIMLTTELEATLAGEVQRFNAAQTIESQTSVVKTDNRIWISNQPQ